MRAKLNLTLQRAKNTYRKNILPRKHLTLNPVKRTYTRTPIKSPFKSPLYKASPVGKRRKVGSSRRLFQDVYSTAHIDERVLPYPPVITSTHQYTVENSNTPCVSEVNDKVECVLNKNGSEDKCDDFMLSFQEMSPEYIAYPLTDENNNGINDTPETNIQTNKPLRSCVLEEMEQLLPDVMTELESHGGQLDKSMLLFFRQVKNKKFPLSNIAFQLWLETVKWHDTKSTTNMRYSEITKLFWKLGWRAFGERFINFMGGFKSHGKVVQGTDQPGKYKPDNSEINFAVPSVKVLRKFDLTKVGGERPPGIYLDVMTFLSTSLEHQSSCLTFDGKKLKMGLTEDSGDVDLLGLEPDETLAEKKCYLKQHIQELSAMLSNLSASETKDLNIQDLSNESKAQVCELLIKTISRISNDIFQVREIRRKKEYCKSKLIERGGETHWRKGKLCFK